jgi:hypothetical protein
MACHHSHGTNEFRPLAPRRRRLRLPRSSTHARSIPKTVVDARVVPPEVVPANASEDVKHDHLDACLVPSQLLALELLRRPVESTQYTALEFTNRLADWGLVASYGSVGDAYDNAAMKTFWATAKKEIDHIWGPVRNFTRSQLRTILFDYIEVFYNRQRHQQALDHRTPTEVYTATRVA